MDKIVDLIASMVSPGKSWGCFFRKTLSTILVASIGAYGYTTYQRLERSHWEDLPLHTAVNEGDIEDRVKKYLQILVSADPSLKSVWLYSWPDARTLIAVAHAGTHRDPLPLGYFLRSDADLVGQLVMEQCACLKRPDKKLLACPIIAENDAWGVLVFEHTVGTDRPSNYKAVYVALSHKLANIIYNNHD
jgi:GAF domain-containing protein